MNIAELLLTLIQVAPTAAREIAALYAAVKSNINETDAAKIDAALANAIAQDAAATEAAGKALDEAAKR